MILDIPMIVIREQKVNDPTVGSKRGLSAAVMQTTAKTQATVSKAVGKRTAGRLGWEPS